MNRDLLRYTLKVAPFGALNGLLRSCKEMASMPVSPGAYTTARRGTYRDNTAIWSELPNGKRHGMAEYIVRGECATISFVRGEPQYWALEMNSELVIGDFHRPIAFSVNTAKSKFSIEYYVQYGNLLRLTGNAGANTATFTICGVDRKIDCTPLSGVTHNSLLEWYETATVGVANVTVGEPTSTTIRSFVEDHVTRLLDLVWPTKRPSPFSIFDCKMSNVWEIAKMDPYFADRFTAYVDTDWSESDD